MGRHGYGYGLGMSGHHGKRETERSEGGAIYRLGQTLGKAYLAVFFLGTVQPGRKKKHDSRMPRRMWISE